MRGTPSTRIPVEGADGPNPTPSDDCLLRRFYGGDEDGATQLYRRYVHRLQALVKARCPANLAARLDVDDIVQSVFRSFFEAANAGAYEVPAGQDLWKLLLTIALNKIRAQGAYHQAAKRDVRLTSSLDVGDSVLPVPARQDAVRRVVGAVRRPWIR